MAQGQSSIPLPDFSLPTPEAFKPTLVPGQAPPADFSSAIPRGNLSVPLIDKPRTAEAYSNAFDKAYTRTESLVEKTGKIIKERTDMNSAKRLTAQMDQEIADLPTSQVLPELQKRVTETETALQMNKNDPAVQLAAQQARWDLARATADHTIAALGVSSKYREEATLANNPILLGVTKERDERFVTAGEYSMKTAEAVREQIASGNAVLQKMHEDAKAVVVQRMARIGNRDPKTGDLPPIPEETFAQLKEEFSNNPVIQRYLSTLPNPEAEIGVLMQFGDAQREFRESIEDKRGMENYDKEEDRKAEIEKAKIKAAGKAAGGMTPDKRLEGLGEARKEAAGRLGLSEDGTMMHDPNKPEDAEAWIPTPESKRKEFNDLVDSIFKNTFGVESPAHSSAAPPSGGPKTEEPPKLSGPTAELQLPKGQVAVVDRDTLRATEEDVEANTSISPKDKKAWRLSIRAAEKALAEAESKVGEEEEVQEETESDLEELRAGNYAGSEEVSKYITRLVEAGEMSKKEGDALTSKYAENKGRFKWENKW